MKTLIFLGHDGTHVELLTDLIDSNQSLTVYQIKEYVNGEMQLGLSNATIAKGFDFAIDEYDLGDLVKFAMDNDYTLIVTETGAEAELLYLAYYYGAPIGICGDLI